MNFVQLLCQLLTKSDGQERLAFEVLLVVLRSVITQVDVHCKKEVQSVKLSDRQVHKTQDRQTDKTNRQMNKGHAGTQKDNQPDRQTGREVDNLSKIIMGCQRTAFWAWVHINPVRHAHLQSGKNLFKMDACTYT